ncbi:MAG TPA: hypothetical protein DCZ84_02955 [Candidatus Vogelbacteria bacterium]|nr:MAG: putative xylanase/chitin deacetylase [Parcubacteria group bacterium GW2011_GWF2_52_12]KKW27459.1 MAG: putative xylanase/chitin deacetylase [Parcubacteria group bacterium GW2011_GWF1_52_5]HBB65564.1 hypothetical protein [Candidatus Vogelbacteria bacterium]HCQ92228.1 hypothetical protein [Candidatus Vogelbacteria bacterium]
MAKYLTYDTSPALENNFLSMSSLKIKVKKALIRAIAPTAVFFHGDGLPRARVISLHDIPEKLKNDFEQKMRWLTATCTMVSLENIYRGERLDKNRLNVALTFDDGFREQATFAAPLLQSLSIPATFFVPSGALGATEEFGRKNLRRHGNFHFMSASELTSLADGPLFEIGGHTMHHTDLGEQLSLVELENEIVQDKKNLETILGKPMHFFAYPFGSIKNLHADSAAMIKNAGYKAAFTIVPSFWFPKGDPYRAGRDSLSLDDQTALWNACLSGGYDGISRFKNFLFK